MSAEAIVTDTVRASLAGHAFHEKWTARRALQLVFPNDDLHAIAVEGLSSTETAQLSQDAEDIADLTLFFGRGDNFNTCDRQQTIQFKYKVNPKPVTSSYLKKTLLKFARTLLDYEESYSVQEVADKISFRFITNADFSSHLWEAIECLKAGAPPSSKPALQQYANLEKWCADAGVPAARLCSMTEFHASTKSLTSQKLNLQATLGSWNPGADSLARARLHATIELVREKAGLSGQNNNLIKREDILDALGCGSEDDLFPAETEFVDVGKIVKRFALNEARKKLNTTTKPIFVFADGSVGKTVFIQSLANTVADEFEVVVFDCFGGGSYRSEDQSRHLPRVGLLQIVNELASRGLCDPQLPTDGDYEAIVVAARRRLEQAAETVRTQTQRKGVLIIIDAADNAQLEADSRKEKAFPRLLLASLNREPIEGVSLLLTARPHRMNSVIGACSVERFEIGVFTKAETREFLESRRDQFTEPEFSTAFARSGGNARVLEYLVASWDQNVSGNPASEQITVEELIEKRCDKIHSDLRLLGWEDDDVSQMFTAISLLPPPIPLSEMCSALDWPESMVNSAVSDLAPMLEVLKHGAIFRDEPTETFIRERYASEARAQQIIADRLYACQKSSLYAAEALPRFLVLMHDSDRAYSLATTKDFPASTQSEYGRRRLRFMRLNAAFSIAVKDRDYDRILKLSLQLAQLASANAKGDEFIRRSPSLAISLGDQDAARRLFQDRSGWRGERDARLVVAYVFQGELEEAEIHQSRLVGWINWHAQGKEDENLPARVGPSASDYAAVIFLAVLKKDYANADRNLARWSFPFALSICQECIALLEQYELHTGEHVFNGLSEFASTKSCSALALQVALLAGRRTLAPKCLKPVARAASAAADRVGKNVFDCGREQNGTVLSVLTDAAFTALLHNSRRSASNITATIKPERVNSYMYSDRFGPFRGQTTLMYACVSTWSKGQKLQFHHLLPQDVEMKRTLRQITHETELASYLKALTIVRPDGRSKGNRKRRVTMQFKPEDCDDIAKAIAMAIDIVQPLQRAVLGHRAIVEKDFGSFLDNWESKLAFDSPWESKSAQGKLCRGMGLCFASLFLRNANGISKPNAEKFIEILGRGNYPVQDKLHALSLLIRHENVHQLCGQFAKEISDHIRQDEYIEQRGEHFSLLAETLLPMSRGEAQQYFREGLRQLDKVGSDDYDTIYALLRYASEQSGGWLRSDLGQRLMNLCQAVFQHDASKFPWQLFGKAAAQSIGTQAIYKLVRWADQDVSDFSNGLPQLSCYLAKSKKIDARRSAFLMLLCEDQGWYEWQIGDGLKDLFDVSADEERKAIWRVLLRKLELEHDFSLLGSIWVSLLSVSEQFPNTAIAADVARVRARAEETRTRTDEVNRRQNSSSYNTQTVMESSDEGELRETETAFERIVDSCDLSVPHSIDEAMLAARKDSRFQFNSHKKIIEHLRERCPYGRQADFISMLNELVELYFDDALEILIETVDLWAPSSTYIAANKKVFIEKLFHQRGSELFDLRYTNALTQIGRLIEFCGDAGFVLDLVFDTVVRERVELSGDEWLGLATSLCHSASPQASVEALEEFLAGPAGQVGDETGEGGFQKAFVPSADECKITAEVTWHLLGNEDTFVRWNTARSIEALVELGLHSDVKALLGLYDLAQVDALTSEGVSASFDNAQQWLLMGLARACLLHGESLSYLREPLERLVNRGEVHAANKIHIIRCLQHIPDAGGGALTATQMRNEVYHPAKGYKERRGWPKQVSPDPEFHLDYEFYKGEIPSFANLFGISDGEAVAAVATEIRKQYPGINDLNALPGPRRYHYGQNHRFESYRESVQKHAMLRAASNLSKIKPVIRESYEPAEALPWVEWLERHDVSSEDGSWLSDHKDAVPRQAKQFLVSRDNLQEALEPEGDLLEKIGLPDLGPGRSVPLRGSWQSSDGVNVQIFSAMTMTKGVIGRCREFSRKPDHDIWLPTFDWDGEDSQNSARSEFEALIWEPERYPIGIDEGDRFATKYPVSRARLGKALTNELRLQTDETNRTWTTPDGYPVLCSQVWGQWRPSPEDHRAWYQDEGQMLWAQSDWLDAAMSRLNRSLVFHIDFRKYKSHRRYEDTQGLRSTYIGLRTKDGVLRTWRAKRASKSVY